MNHLLVTGGAGFIGSSFASRLLRQNFSGEIVLLDSFTPFYNPNWKRRYVAELLQPATTKISLLELDIAADAAMLTEKLATKVKDGRQWTLVHLAAQAGVRPSVLDPAGFARVNAMGTMNMLEVSRRLGISTFINASSSSVYGRNSSVPFQESQAVNRPQSPYAATKMAAEIFCENFAQLHQFRCTSLRFFTVYGPRQRPDLAIHSFTNKILKGETVHVFGDGSSSRDYTFVDDIVDGLLAAVRWTEEQSLDRGFHELINLGSSNPIPLAKLIGLLEEVIGKKAKTEHLPFPEEDMITTFADVRKAKTLLGYEPKVSIQEGLARFYDWHRSWYKQS